MKGKGTTIKRTILGFLLLVLLFILVYLFINNSMPDLIPLLTSGDRAAIEEMLENEHGVYAVLLTIAMEFLQTFSIIIPGMPINIAAGLVFGGFIGTLICTVGFVAANVSVFILAKRLQGLVERIIPSNSEKSKRWRFISKSKNPITMITIAYAIPGVPNGVIPCISAEMTITVKMYTFAVLFGSLPGIAFSNFIGHFLLEKNYWAVLILVIAWLLFFVLLVKNKKFVHNIVKRFLV